jgi:hypothetical protein
MPHMVLDGLIADEQLPGYLFVPVTLRHQSQTQFP